MGELHGRKIEKVTGSCNLNGKTPFPSASVSKHLHTMLLAKILQLEPVVGIEPEVPM